jgi:hypothetical protein
LALIRRRRHLIPAITFKITYIIGGHHARRARVFFFRPRSGTNFIELY